MLARHLDVILLMLGCGSSILYRMGVCILESGSSGGWHSSFMDGCQPLGELTTLKIRVTLGYPMWFFCCRGCPNSCVVVVIDANDFQQLWSQYAAFVVGIAIPPALNEF